MPCVVDDIEIFHFVIFLRLTIDGVINATYISVRNANFYTETKERRTIEGYAWLLDPNQPGQLKLQLAGVPVVGDCK